MCGRFSQAMSLAELLERFPIFTDIHQPWQTRFNIAPTLDVPVLVQMPGAKAKLTLMNWGMAPPWSKGPAYRPLINLRSDTLLNKPGFKRILETSRCLVPVDGFYEWKTEGKRKFPYRFVMNAGGIFNLAGLYTAAHAGGKALYTFCLITTEANAVVSKVHDRMPVIIPRDKEAAWLSPESRLADYVTCLAPYPSDEMCSYEVSTKINSGKIDTPDLIAPIS